jgi:DNA-binding transcriptional ArsR family regulator
MTNEPESIIILSNPEQIKGYIHPTRITILEKLAFEKRTISSVAKEFGVHPANITHHFRLLEKLELIRLVEKRDTGKNLEKYYRASAYHFVVKPKNDNKINKNTLALSILKENLTSAIGRVRENDTVLALLNTMRIGTARVNEFTTELKKLVTGFQESDTTSGKAYTINVSFYPEETEIIPLKIISIQDNK